MTPPPFTLASKSAARTALLAGAGVPFQAAGADVDEEALKTGLLADGCDPRQIAEALAQEKAVKVSSQTAGLVLGADQTLDLDGVLYDKAQGLDAAREKLKSLRGKTHRLHSALVIARDGAPIWRETATASLTMRAFSDEWLEIYLAANPQILSCVGCYQLEGQGVQLFDRIEGDYFTILGLPITGLLAFLRGYGVVGT